MKHFLVASVGMLTAALAFSSAGRSQDTPTRGPGQVDQRPPSVYEKLANSGPGGPAPVHDLTGFWNGPLEPKFADAPSLTPLGAIQIQDEYSRSLQRAFERSVENVRSVRLPAQRDQ